MTTSFVAEALRSEPEFRTTLNLCGAALRRVAEYELDPVINQRMRELGERKDRLTEQEHNELISLVDFSERRSVEKLEARLALEKLSEVVPEILATNP